MASKIGGSWQQLGVSKSRHQGKKKKAGPHTSGSKKRLSTEYNYGNNHGISFISCGIPLQLWLNNRFLWVELPENPIIFIIVLNIRWQFYPIVRFRFRGLRPFSKLGYPNSSPIWQPEACLALGDLLMPLGFLVFFIVVTSALTLKLKEFGRKPWPICSKRYIELYYCGCWMEIWVCVYSIEIH